MGTEDILSADESETNPWLTLTDVAQNLGLRYTQVPQPNGIAAIFIQALLSEKLRTPRAKAHPSDR
jgi:prophage antirepressor-like protein